MTAGRVYVIRVRNVAVYVGATKSLLRLRWPPGVMKRKFGEDAIITALQECRSKKALDAAEQYWIALLRPRFNISVGGPPATGIRLTEDHKAKLLAANLGNQKAKGLVHTSESRAKMSAASKAYWVQRKKP